MNLIIYLLIFSQHDLDHLLVDVLMYLLSNELDHLLADLVVDKGQALDGVLLLSHHEEALLSCNSPFIID